MTTSMRSNIKADTDFSMLECIDDFIKNEENPTGCLLVYHNNPTTIKSRNLFQYFSTVPTSFDFVFEGGYDN